MKSRVSGIGSLLVLACIGLIGCATDVGTDDEGAEATDQSEAPITTEWDCSTILANNRICDQLDVQGANTHHVNRMRARAALNHDTLGHLQVKIGSWSCNSPQRFFSAGDYIDMDWCTVDRNFASGVRIESIFWTFEGGTWKAVVHNVHYIP